MPPARSPVDWYHAPVPSPLPAVALFHGEDGYLRVEGMRRLVARAVAPEDVAWDVGWLPPAQADQAAALLMVRPLGPLRVVVLDLEELPGESAAGGLEARIRSPLPATLLVLGVRRLDGRTRLGRLLASAAHAFACGPMTMAQAIRWAAAEARERGLSPRPGYLERLVNRIGPSPGRIAQELEKARAYGGEELDPAWVDLLAAPVPHEGVFALMAAVLAGSARDALGRLDDLLAQGEKPLGIVSLLEREYRLVAAARDALRSGCARAELPGRAGIPPFALGRYLDAERRLGEKALDAAVMALYETDRAIKTGTDAPWALERLILRLLGPLAPAAPETPAARRP